MKASDEGSGEDLDFSWGPEITELYDWAKVTGKVPWPKLKIVKRKKKKLDKDNDVDDGDHEEESMTFYGVTHGWKTGTFKLSN